MKKKLKFLILDKKKTSPEKQKKKIKIKIAVQLDCNGMSLEIGKIEKRKTRLYIFIC